MRIGGGGVKSAGRQIQIERERVFVFAGDFLENGVQLHQIGFVGFQQHVQFLYSVLYLLIDGLVILQIFETDREFHVRTCRWIAKKRVGYGLHQNATSSGA
jgi:hypothetical protein